MDIQIETKEVKVSEPTGIMALVNKRVQKSVKFMGADVKIAKLSVSEAKAIQALAKEIEGREASDEDTGLEVLEMVIKSSVEGASELTREHFEAWPHDELAKLSNAIMEFSGFTTKGEEGNAA